MFLITGAAGKTGRAVTRALVARGMRVRALVRRPEQVEVLQKLGAGEAAVGDMRLASSLKQACQGVTGIYHICPNMHPDELQIGEKAIQAARRHGLEHFVFHSVLHPQTEAMPHHWQKLQVEEKLLESGLPFTILQPAPYMQNLANYWTAIREEGVYAVPYPASTRLSLVDLKDVAEAAAVVAANPKHMGATYELCGTEGLAQDQVAGVVGSVLGRQVKVKAISLTDWEQKARASGLNEYAVQSLLKMFRYYAKYGLWGSPQVLKWLLERPPGTLEEFVGGLVSRQGIEPRTY